MSRAGRVVEPRPEPKRKKIPLGVKVAVLTRMAADLGLHDVWADERTLGQRYDLLLEWLGLTGKQINWSHEPALGLRPINRRRTDYKPKQLDPRYIFARLKEDHARLTFVDNGTGRSDQGAIAHGKRIRRKERAHKARRAGNPVPEKRKRAWPKRKFPKGRKFQRRAI